MVWRRLLLAIQLVVFVTAGFFATSLTPLARPLQDATGPVATTPHDGARVVASRERTGERIGRVRKDHQSGDAIASTPTGTPVVAPASFVVEPPRVHVAQAPRRLRFSPHAPRGPPPLG